VRIALCRRTDGQGLCDLRGDIEAVSARLTYRISLGKLEPTLRM
jgi:hypothetical protein